MPGDDRVAEFSFTSGVLRGTWLSLHNARLLHEGTDASESIPLAGVCAVRVAFERSARGIGWGVALILIALATYAVSGSLAALAHGAASELAAQGAKEAAAGQGGVAGVLIASFRLLEGTARMMPFAAVAAAGWGAALIALGWRGFTTLTLLFAATEREFPARGRDPRLFEFAEAINQRIAELR